MSYILVLFLGLAVGAFAEDEQVDARQARCKTIGDEWTFNSLSPACVSVCQKKLFLFFWIPNAKVMADDTPCKLPLTDRDGVCLMSVCLDPAVAESVKNLRDKSKEEASKIAKDLSDAVNNIKDGGKDLIDKSMDAAKKFIQNLVDKATGKDKE